MKTIHIHKAQSSPDALVPSLTIELTNELPPLGTSSFATMKDRFREEGRQLASALYLSLPGGTVDALLVELLERKASLLRVPA